MISYKSYVLSVCRTARDSLEKSKYPGLVLDCPVCHSAEHTYMRASTGNWVCYKCGAGGDFATYVQAIEHLSYSQTQRRLQEIQDSLGLGTLGDLSNPIAGSGLMAEDEGDEDDEELKTVPLPAEYQPLLYNHPYLESRLVTPAEVRWHLFGYCDQGYYKGRIIIPILENAKILGFVARDYTGNPTFGKKILNPAISTSSMVWNIDTCYHYSRIVVCEGVFSALRVGPDAVATFGKSLGWRQMRKMAEFGAKQVVLMYDSDVDLDDKRMRRRLAYFADLVDLYVVRMETGDPGDHPRGYLRDLIDRATPYGAYAETTFYPSSPKSGNRSPNPNAPVVSVECKTNPILSFTQKGIR